jgi:hypothetical protein
MGIFTDDLEKVLLPTETIFLVLKISNIIFNITFHTPLLLTPLDLEESWRRD